MHARVLFAILIAILATSPAATAYTYKKLYGFCAMTNCADGKTPGGALVMDASGTLYGTTAFGGSIVNTPDGGGVAYSLTLNAAGTKWKFKTLYRFCQQSQCADGQSPGGGLIVDIDGNLYGTTSAGGANGKGTIFELSPQSGEWSHHTLYSFCAASNCTDGFEPHTGLTYVGAAAGQPWDGFSPLFGTTHGGGAHDLRTVYRLVNDGTLWFRDTIRDFTVSADPQPLLADASGNLFGTTRAGGAFAGGLMYKLEHDTWKQTVLHAFCSQTDCADGSQPNGRLSMDGAGRLYGTTLTSHGTGGGVVFRATPAGAHSPFHVLHEFCVQANCSDGSNPIGGVVVDPSGNLLGTAQIDGKYGHGTVYKLDAANNWKRSTLYDFCKQAGCPDGQLPSGGLIPDAHGNVFGVTPEGGANGGGEAFEIAP